MKDKSREEATKSPELAAQLAAIVQFSNDAIIGKTLDGIITSWNKGATKMYGYREDEVVGRPISLLVPPGREDRVQQILDKIKHGEPVEHYETVRRRKDGQDIYVSLTVSPIWDAEGRIVAAATIGRDITEQRRADERLRQSEERLRLAQQTAKIGTFEHNLRTGIITWTAELEEMYGLAPGSFAGTQEAFINLIHPDDRAKTGRLIEESLTADGQSEGEWRVIWRDGSIHWLYGRWQVLKDKLDQPASVFGFGIDITERKQAEELLRNSEKNLCTIIETIPAFVRTANPDGSIDFVSQSWLDYMGLSREDWVGWGWVNRVHPEDRDRVVEGRRQMLATGGPREREFRIRQANGEYRWFLSRHEPLRDEKGNIIKWYGVMVDIEDRKRAEEQIRNSERNLRTTIDTIPAYVFSALPDGSFDFASQNWFDYSGLSPEEVYGWDWTDVVHPEDRDQAVAKWRESMATGVPGENEHRVRQANGEYRWFLARNAALRDGGGSIVRWYAVLVDIEEQKQAEARLRQALDEIQKLQEQLSKENIVLREEIDRTSMFEEIVGSSPALKAVLARMDKVAPTDSIVLITGETGTGKELVARAIHKRSPRTARTFVSVNCAAIPAPLIASELFGHEKGAFTGAHQRRLGRFELAEGGTIFLDEIGELPMETQIALLRVLQDQVFERLGGSQPIRANARVITATNRDLEVAIAAGSFRRDLFYRLNVFPIEIPPLRERKEDIPLLVEYFIHRYASKLGKKIRRVSKKTLDMLQSYSWPGNIRELQNVLERSTILCDSEIFSVNESCLFRESRAAQPVGQTFSDTLATQTKEMIEAALAESGGRVSGPSGAAAKLGMPASTLESKIKSLKINKYLFKKST